MPCVSYNQNKRKFHYTWALLIQTGHTVTWSVFCYLFKVKSSHVFFVYVVFKLQNIKLIQHIFFSLYFPVSHPPCSLTTRKKELFEFPNWQKTNRLPWRRHKPLVMLMSNQHHILLEWRTSFTTSSEAVPISKTQYFRWIRMGELLIRPAGCFFFFVYIYHCLTFLAKKENHQK